MKREARYFEMTAQQERIARRLANNELYAMGTHYHDSLPIASIDRVLTECGFNETEPAIYCGRDGRCSQQVGARTWLSLFWHKMDSGRYEVIAYVN
jgi:hypothetical protein